MKRKCDRCDREATVHEVTIKDGAKVEKHLCESCAREEGVVVQAHAPINELITKFVMSHSGQGATATRSQACGACGLKYQEFRQHGLLGCAECYKSFESQLGPLVERAQDGATHHIGKAPASVVGSVDRQQRIVTLRKQLTDAIAAEQYERAAQLRDQLMHVEKKPEGGKGAAGGSAVR